MSRLHRFNRTELVDFFDAVEKFQTRHGIEIAYEQTWNDMMTLRAVFPMPVPSILACTHHDAVHPTACTA